MKKIILILLVLAISLPAFSKLRDEDLNQPAMTSAGAMLLTQADVVAIHFSRSGIIYAPKLVNNKVLFTGTVVDNALLSNVGAMRTLAEKQVSSLEKVMMDRVSFYVPAISEVFKSNDMRFVIESRAGVLGRYENGKWHWLSKPAYGSAKKAYYGEGAVATIEMDKPVSAAEEGSTVDCNCPSRVGKKK